MVAKSSNLDIAIFKRKKSVRKDTRREDSTEYGIRITRRGRRSRPPAWFWPARVLIGPLLFLWMRLK